MVDRVSNHLVLCVYCAASRPNLPGQGGAGVGMQLPCWYSKGESAEGNGACVNQLLIRPQEPHLVRTIRPMSWHTMLLAKMHAPIK